ncbi:phosphatase domain-containing protein [Litoreibacter roseus]|uniref:Phosphatase n=1 Tax=Litoreibacter roseus TaxID=2601869 RepID=A0A6N6JEY9_9RHOB|nr:phosphatase domain-containing protein [Litoreibacter roseus]GFE64715.1 phosphatase [Litoreibacter roseus]
MIKNILHKISLFLERAADMIWRRNRTGQVIEPYYGYSTPDEIVLRGRVLAASAQRIAQADQSWFTNLRQMVGLFLTSEVADVEVRASDVTAKTDEEGYFTIRLPRPKGSGWIEVPAHLEDQPETAVTCPVRISPEDAQFLVASDIDDTMLKTGAYSVLKNLWTSLTGNALTRVIFPDAIVLMNALAQNGRNPIFYVSSSPWNFHKFLSDVFAHAGLVRGPKFLRDLGLSESQFITGTHGDHKSSAIDTILASNPSLPAILIGDTGQHDAMIYLSAIRRHPGRIKTVILREPGPGPNTEGKQAMAEIEAEGVQLLHGVNFKGMVDQIDLADPSQDRERS